MTPVLEGILSLMQAEFEMIHALCDRCHVPRETEEAGGFSAAQRVAILAGVLEGFVARIGDHKPETLQ